MQTPDAPSFGRRFWPMFALGLVGIASLPLTFPPMLDARLQAAAPAIPLAVLKSLTLLQPALLLALGAALGAATAHRVGLGSHVVGINIRRAFARECPLAVVLGLVGGFAIVLVDRLVFRTGIIPLAETPWRNIVEGLVGGVLYGGLTEEVMMRWGLLSLVAWALVKVVRGRSTSVLPFVMAIIITAIAFGAAHLPAAAMIGPLDTVLVVRILTLNGLAGLVLGALYWRRSIEAAMLAHMSMHVAFAIARASPWG